MSSPSKSYSWGFLETFNLENVALAHDWEIINRLISSSRKAVIPLVEECKQLEHEWDERLTQLFGSGHSFNWNTFRPLRLSREEDWSDWLAWLIECSRTGAFAESIFSKFLDDHAEAFQSPTVRREFNTDGRRTDIIIAWRNAKLTSIEVKIWDQNFEKTFDTVRKLRKQKQNCEGGDFILIPRASLHAWTNVVDDPMNANAIQVECIHWEDVVRAVRKCLWNEDEGIVWLIWAWTFCCMIETAILETQRVGDASANVIPSEIQMILKRLNALKRDW